MDEHHGSLRVTDNAASEQAEFQPEPVTRRRPGTPAAERKRQERARKRAPAIHYTREDWKLFLDIHSLPQKAGCQPDLLRSIVVKELVDNALDAGAKVELEPWPEAPGGSGWAVRDNGPGIPPKKVPELFCVNRPLISSKRKRLPLRGMLGNGLRVVMGAVAATDGALIVETAGWRLQLKTNRSTGETFVESSERTARVGGTTVRIALGKAYSLREADTEMARSAIALAVHGVPYDGPSSPWWYSAKDLHSLFSDVGKSPTVSDVLTDLGIEITDHRPAHALSAADVAVVLQRLRDTAKQIPPERLGKLGGETFQGCQGYVCKTGTTPGSGARLPYIVEVWAWCERAVTRGQGDADVELYINRTPTAAVIHADASGTAITLRGCGLRCMVSRVPTGQYHLVVSVIVPSLQLAGDGKEPVLTPFVDAIIAAKRGACGAAHRALGKPPAGRMNIKQAAAHVMPIAYREASGGGRLPANARQIMYAARPRILQLTGNTELDDRYFTQTILPAFLRDHPAETANWDVVFDDRGSFYEPHTNHEVALGTIEVRKYINRHPPAGGAALRAPAELFPTSGPQHRYKTVLFIEKEGFWPLLKAATIAERFDIAIMSTKGMSTVAARRLLDHLAGSVDQILVLHDFDTSGFSILGTLSTDSKRYTFENEVPVIDIGLRLDDVLRLGLKPEPTKKRGDWAKSVTTLVRHGANAAERHFMRTDRVELNAMSADGFVAFLEEKLRQHGVTKMVPERLILERQARRVIEQHLAQKVVDQMAPRLAQEAATAGLPTDLGDLVEECLKQHPKLSWDGAVSLIMDAR